jgi:hypothetical protein
MVGRTVSRAKVTREVADAPNDAIGIHLLTTMDNFYLSRFEGVVAENLQWVISGPLSLY